MDCLNLDQLTKALDNNTPLDWHPDYFSGPDYKSQGKPSHEPDAPFYILRINSYSDIYLQDKNGRKVAKSVDNNGIGVGSGKPIFIYYKDPASGITIGNIRAVRTTPCNNDGRSECAFCGAPTRKAGGGMYDICTKCGK